MTRGDTGRGDLALYVSRNVTIVTDEERKSKDVLEFRWLTEYCGT